ncbi:MAG: excinuclease ABC subunit C, partial [Thalassolituus sp.]
LIADVDSDLFAPVIAVLKEQGVGLKHQRGSRGEPRKWLASAQENARAGIQSVLSGRQAALNKLEAVAELLGMAEAPKRIECFDISHSQG